MPISASDLEREAFIRALLMGWAKVGKAQPLDEPVLTPDGWRVMGDLRVGSQVIGSDGQPVRVTGVYPQGRKQVVRLKTSAGSWTRCCPEHLWFTSTKRELTRGRWAHTDGPHADRVYTNTKTWGSGSVKTAQEIRATLSSGDQDSYHFLPEMTGPVRYVEEQPLTFDPYFIGLLIGDGSYVARAGNVTFTSRDEELFEAVRRGAVANGDELIRTNPEERCPFVRIRGVRTKEQMQALGLWGQRSENKKPPSAIFQASPESRLAFLQGLMDTDGYAMIRDNAGGRASQAEFCSTSRVLAEAVVELVRSLGGRARIKCKETSCQTGPGLPAYIVTFGLTYGCPFRLTRKAAVWGVEKQRDWRLRITEIVDDGEAECVCISVDAEDALYVTRGYILTHNTKSTIVSLVELAGYGYVITPGDKSSLGPAMRATKKFEFDLVRDEVDMDACLKTAREGVKEKKYGWVFIDDYSLYGSTLEGLLRDESAKQNKSGKPDGRTWSPEFKNRILNTVRRAFDLKCHLVVASHYIEQSGEIVDQQTGNVQRAKSGRGIMPMLYGSAREELPALFTDVLFMEKIDDRRVFQVNPDGVWGPGSRSVDGTHTIDASFVEFMKLTKSGELAKAPPPKGGKR